MRDMLNAFGQDVVKGSYVAQITRNKDGLVKRVGVVLRVGEDSVRTAWYDEDSESGTVESSVHLDGLVLIDRLTIPAVHARVLDYAWRRGKAAL